MLLSRKQTRNRENSGKRTPLSVLALFLLLSSLSGCSTPFFSTDNKFLLCLPGAERKSDEIDGVLRPWERIELIQEKGKKGSSVGPEEKEILLLQLCQEYERSQDPNVRRAAIAAIAKIVATTASSSSEKVLMKALHDESLGVQLSAIEALGTYGSSLKEGPERIKLRQYAVEQLATFYRECSYSISAGAKKKNNINKDLRLAILRNLEQFKESDSKELLPLLEEAFQGEKLDDGALQLGAMRTLGIISHKKYGFNSDLWLQYIEFRQGKRPEAPKELSFTERLPKPDLSIFK